MKKIFFLILTTIFFLTPVKKSYAQELQEVDMEESSKGITSQTGQNIILSQKKEKTYDIFFTLGPNLMLNTDSPKNSAPHPIMYSLGFGMDFFTNLPVRFQPHVHFFTNYYLWDGEAARPAEVENRTATVFSAMLDLNAIYSLSYGQNIFQFGGGIGFLARYGILSNGVKSSDEGGGTNTTAGDDVSKINSYLMGDMRFLYPEVSFSYLRNLGNFSVGGEFRAYIPLASLSKGDGLDAAIFSLSAKIVIK